MKKFYGHFSLSGAFILAGTSVVSARFVSGSLGNFSIAALSLFFAVIGLLPFCGARLISLVFRLKVREWISLCLQALFGIFLFRMFLLKGLMLTSAGEAGLLTGATPAATAFLAFLLLKERIYGTRVIGIICTVSGIILIQGVLIFENGFFKGHFLGNILVLCAAVCESLFNVFSRMRILKSVDSEAVDIDPITQTTLVSFIALVLCIIPALRENIFLSLAFLAPAQWLALGWYGFIVTALAFIFWYEGISRCEASTAAVFSGLMPFTSMLLSIFLLGENPGWQQWLGGILVVSGMILSSIKTNTVLSFSPGTAD